MKIKDKMGIADHLILMSASGQIAPMSSKDALAIEAALTATPQQHADDIAVDRFAAAMKAKLAKKRAEGRGGWQDKDECPRLFLSQLLREHIDKGDPVDVGNLAMMIHQRGELIADAPQPELVLDLAYKEARRLAVSLGEKHYPEVTQWQPLEDIRGVISQIDNMTTGLVRREAPAPNLMEEVKRVLAPFDEAAGYYSNGLRRAVADDATPCGPALIVKHLRDARALLAKIGGE